MTTETIREYKYTLDADDFVKLFLASDEEFDDLKSNLLIDNAGCITRQNGLTRLKDTRINGNIPIKNQVSALCTPLFCEQVKMDNLIIVESTLNYGKYGTRFNFQLCEIDGIYVNSNSIIGDLFIEKDCKVGPVEISQATVGYIQIDFTSIENISVKENSKTKTIHTLYTIIGDITIAFSSVKNIDISSSSIMNLRIEESNCNNLNLYLIMITSLSIINTKLIESSISECISQKGVFFSYSTLRTLRIGGYFGILSIYDVKMLELGVSGSNISYLRLTQHNEFDAFISNSNITKLDLSRTILNNRTTITFSNVAFFAIDISDFTCQGSLFFRRIIKLENPTELISFKKFIKPLVNIVADNKKLDSPFHILAIYARKLISEWKIKYLKVDKEFNKNANDLNLKKGDQKIKLVYSSLAKTEFTDCPLNDFRFEFNNSKINECFVSGGSIPSDNVYIPDVVPNSVEEYVQKSSFFNQFRKIFEAQGDIYNATKFQSRWAENQRKVLKYRKRQEYDDAKKPVLWSKVKIFFNSTSNDQFTLWLNKISNLHGESWLKTIGVFFCVIIPIIYVLYLTSIRRAFVSNSEFDITLIWKYFVFLNPTHSSDFIDKNYDAESHFAIVLDYFGRIVVAYGIYQFIAAFRKHTKKK